MAITPFRGRGFGTSSLLTFGPSKNGLGSSESESRRLAAAFDGSSEDRVTLQSLVEQPDTTASKNPLVLDGELQNKIRQRALSAVKSLTSYAEELSAKIESGEGDTDALTRELQDTTSQLNSIIGASGSGDLATLVSRRDAASAAASSATTQAASRDSEISSLSSQNALLDTQNADLTTQIDAQVALAAAKGNELLTNTTLVADTTNVVNSVQYTTDVAAVSYETYYDNSAQSDLTFVDEGNNTTYWIRAVSVGNSVATLTSFETVVETTTGTYFARDPGSISSESAAANSSSSLLQAQLDGVVATKATNVTAIATKTTQRDGLLAVASAKSSEAAVYDASIQNYSAPASTEAPSEGLSHGEFTAIGSSPTSTELEGTRDLAAAYARATEAKNKGLATIDSLKVDRISLDKRPESSDEAQELAKSISAKVSSSPAVALDAVLSKLTPVNVSNLLIEDDDREGRGRRSRGSGIGSDDNRG